MSGLLLLFFSIQEVPKLRDSLSNPRRLLRNKSNFLRSRLQNPMERAYPKKKESFPRPQRDTEVGVGWVSKPGTGLRVPGLPSGGVSGDERSAGKGRAVAPHSGVFGGPRAVRPSADGRTRAPIMARGKAGSWSLATRRPQRPAAHHMAPGTCVCARSLKRPRGRVPITPFVSGIGEG